MVENLIIRFFIEFKELYGSCLYKANPDVVFFFLVRPLLMFGYGDFLYKVNPNDQ